MRTRHITSAFCSVRAWRARQFDLRNHLPFTAEPCLHLPTTPPCAPAPLFQHPSTLPRYSAPASPTCCTTYYPAAPFLFLPGCLRLPQHLLLMPTLLLPRHLPISPSPTRTLHYNIPLHACHRLPFSHSLPPHHLTFSNPYFLCPSYLPAAHARPLTTHTPPTPCMPSTMPLPILVVCIVLDGQVGVVVTVAGRMDVVW